jgi:hypothetical protein
MVEKCVEHCLTLAVQPIFVPVSVVLKSTVPRCESATTSDSKSPKLVILYSTDDKLPSSVR